MEPLNSLTDMKRNFKRCIIMVGTPGTGKSTFAAKLLADFDKTNPNSPCMIVSADDYFIERTGKYNFRPERLGRAHEYCFDLFKQAIFYGNELIVVDNTNSKWADYSKYVKAALLSGYSVELMQPDTPWKNDAAECHKRCVHGVPLETIERTLKNIQTERENALNSGISDKTVSVCA